MLCEQCMHSVNLIRRYVNGLRLNRDIEKFVCMILCFRIRNVGHYFAHYSELFQKKMEHQAYLPKAIE